jgi:hypothetical protein
MNQQKRVLHLYRSTRFTHPNQPYTHTGANRAWKKRRYFGS